MFNKNIPSFFRVKTQLIILLGVFSLSIIISYSDLDIAVSHFFYDQIQQRWFTAEYSFFGYLNQLLAWPIWLLVLYHCCCIAYFLLIKQYFTSSLNKQAIQLATKLWDRIYFLLSVLANVGLILTIKLSTSRPRPWQTDTFGGEFEHRPATLNDAQAPIGVNDSFPSGHAFYGYMFLALFYYFYPQKRSAYWAYALAMLGGVFSSFTRVLQGRHFLSDVIASYSVVSLGIIIGYFWLPLLASKVYNNPICKAGLKKFGSWIKGYFIKIPSSFKVMLGWFLIWLALIIACYKLVRVFV